MSKRILHVEDVEDVRELIRTGVNAYAPEFEIDFAASADEAFRMIAKRYYDAVILDVNLMGETGVAVATVIREKYPRKPMAFLTAYDRSITHENAEELGIEVWTKPIHDLRELVDCIKKLVESLPSGCGEGVPGVTDSPLSMPHMIRKITGMIF